MAREREEELRNKCYSSYTKSESEFYPCNAVLTKESSNSHEEAPFNAIDLDFAYRFVDVFCETRANLGFCNIIEEDRKDLCVLHTSMDREPIQV